MTKHFCDACGKEENRLYNMPFLVHIKDENIFRGHVKEIDGEWHRVSGRDEVSELCLVCYNKVAGEAWKVLKSIQNEQK